jgi:hypothetical protein
MKEKVPMSEMTMRDYFAGEVLAGTMGRVHIPAYDLNEWAIYAYQAADAMMKVRNGEAEREDGTADSKDD